MACGGGGGLACRVVAAVAAAAAVACAGAGPGLAWGAAQTCLAPLPSNPINAAQPYDAGAVGQSLLSAEAVNALATASAAAAPIQPMEVG